jgi:hypothetical protein
VTGSSGTGANMEPTPAYGGSYNPSAPRPASPYVPQWLAGRTPTGVAGLAMQQMGGQVNPLTGTTQPGTGAVTGTTAGRTPNPNTGMPDFPMLADLESGPTGGGYSTWKKWKRRGGGGRGRGFYAPQDYEKTAREPFVPSAGLANWSIG